MHGAVCVGTLAEGTVDGKPVRRFMYQTTSHDEAFEKYGVQGTGLQTGVTAACGAIMFINGLIQERGVLAPERIDPQPFLDLLNKHGTPWGVIDLPPAD
jgi:saccharopine dehydrogenase (NAD+, L-lysine-forming)